MSEIDGQLARLHELVRAAQAIVDRPFEPGESARPIEFINAHLTEEGWQLGWGIVHSLRRDHADLFALYDESQLLFQVLDLIRSREAVPALEEIADALRAAGSDDRQWLIQIPLANMIMDRPWAPAGATAAVLRAVDTNARGETVGAETADEESTNAIFGIYEHLGDRLQGIARTLRRQSGTVTDTGRTASLLIVEDGPERMAYERARAKAHYAVATWSVLEPPAEGRLLPDVSVWSPQPYLLYTSPRKPLEQGEWIAKERSTLGRYREFAPYELPSDEVLAAPFEAFDHLDRRSGQALLSATIAWFAAGRASRLLLSQRVREVRTAVECLCDPGPGARGARERWEALTQRLGVWDRLTDVRSYSDQDLRELQQRLVNARNISTHGADVSLIDLGWRGGDRPLMRGVAPATDLEISALHRDLSAMLFAVGEGLRGVWREVRASGFDDAAFDGLFN